uniref:Uncharacterized protein n=1 Tax=Thermodesulfobacterium geofontis TaxID=1295609 RepID=A0A7V4JQU1_9BACT
MLKKDLIKEEFLSYKKCLKKEEKILMVEKPKPPKTKDLRELQLFPPLYVVLVDKFSYYNEFLYKAAILTEEIELGWLTPDAPILKLDFTKTVLVGLPFWVYLEENFLYKYSRRLGSLKENELFKLVEYVEKTKIPETLQGEYIRLVMKRLASYNTASLLEYLEKFETMESFPEIIQLPLLISESLEEYKIQKAASSKNVFKGKNFLAIIEMLPEYARLIVYLPQEYIGKTISVWIKRQKVFEGELRQDKLIFEPLPKLLDYSFLEEELNVQV